MSEPTRYRPAGVGVVIQDPNGPLIAYGHYEELLAEVERLRAFTTTTIIPNDQLQAQVDRLTKAGDGMASSIQFNEEMSKDYNGPTIIHYCVKRWNDAKEGKDIPNG
jgi:hypothetical protein